jgi:hypothetical protein
MNRYRQFLEEKLSIVGDLDWKGSSECVSELEVTEWVLSKGECYYVIDIDYKTRVGKQHAQELFDGYKQYSEPEAWKLTVDHSIDTSETEYVISLNVTTEGLVDAFGELQRFSGNNSNPKIRYEYKMTLSRGGKVHTFSVYDYKVDDCYTWHVASETQNKSIIKAFLGSLEQKKIEF